VLVLELFVTSAFSASAGIFVDNMPSIPSANQVMGDIEQRYHMDQGSLQNQGEMMNVNGKKGYAPEVSLFFTPTDPKEGEKISAKAFPMYFSSTEQAMYYTWYLKRKGCELDDHPDPEKLNLCNRNTNSRIDVEDWKIEAMRMIVQNGYDSATADYTATSRDNDEYFARFGGDNKVDTPSYCYVHDNNSGTNYELVKNGDNPACHHLFPNAPGETSGDGLFRTPEEEFWGTNPQDPSTADNGNKDEANVVGLGQSTLTWNYVAGDKVGVVVEGTAMYPTKYDDSSNMTMWAFTKKDCPPQNTGVKNVNVKGYNVDIPTARMDLNDCINNNLVDPTKGGQATNLSVSVSASPANPVNDPTDNKSGDSVVVHAMIDNAGQNLANIFFDWTVEISNNIGFSNVGTNFSKPVTVDFRNKNLLGGVKGNALDTIKLKLDIIQNVINTYNLLNGDTGYLRFKVTATENFSNGVTRKGKSDVIVKFVSTTDIITAYKVNANLADETMKVSLSGTNICNSDPLERTVCRVIKNEIIGLKVSDPNLTNYYWTINGAPLLCTAKVSTDCGIGKVDAETQGDTNYFPVTGDVGDTYTVAVTANNVQSGKVITLSRAFNIVAPKVVLESVEKDMAWPKFLGQYKDIANLADPVTGTPTCPSGFCDDFSESIFQTTTGNKVGFRSVFIPAFLSASAVKEWSVDGTVVAEVPNPTNAAEKILLFDATKEASGIYTINLLAQVIQPEKIRRALLDIWGITPFESPEINFSVTNQVEVQSDIIAQGEQSGPRKYFAAIASYIPASILFTFRVFLFAILTLFALSFLNALLEERRVKAFAENFSHNR
jgi:hypothetical protein